MGQDQRRRIRRRPAQRDYFRRVGRWLELCDQLASATARGLFERAISESGFYNSIAGVNTSFQPQDRKATLPTESQADAAGQAFAQTAGVQTRPISRAVCAACR